MNFHIITLFPHAFDSYLAESILKRAREDKKIRVTFYDPKDFGPAKTKKNPTYDDRRIDDKPYGGGPGMVLEALPVIKAIAKAVGRKKNVRIIFLSPQGKQFTNEYAREVVGQTDDVVIICGRYEGIDARVKEVFPVEEVSVGPFVLTGGEVPAMLILDVLARQVEGVLGNFNSLEDDRTASPDVYTRPAVFSYKKKKYQVPEVLLSGDHAKIEAWKQSRRRQLPNS
jgi:tRNA (guanine37-N1)-methyltransferase